MVNDPEQNDTTKSWRWKLYPLALVLIVAGAFALFYADLPVAKFCKENAKSGGILPGDLKKFLNLSEVFGHGFGIGLIGITYFFLEQHRRLAVVRIMAGAFGAGIFANVFKMLLISRTRPHSFEITENANVMDTFNNWAPLFTSGSFDLATESSRMGTPSGHTAAAAGLAVLMAWRFPHARLLFVVFVVLAASQRIVSGAHFVSDTCWGAAVGATFGAFCISPFASNLVFDKIERLEKRNA